jgi:uncharacterized membrane protein
VNGQLLIPVIWTLAGALLVKLWSAWSQLPGRVAVHFGMSLEPNGWSSRGAMAAIMTLVALGQAALATWLILRVTSASAMIGPIQLVVSVVLIGTFWQVINYNTKGSQFQPLWIVIPMLLLFATITALLLQMTFRFYRR